MEKRRRGGNLMKESTIENYLVRRCKELGVLCYKFVSPEPSRRPRPAADLPPRARHFRQTEGPRQVAHRTPEDRLGNEWNATKAEVGWTDEAGVDSLLLTWGYQDTETHGYGK